MDDPSDSESTRTPSDAPDSRDSFEGGDESRDSRFRLVWDVILFQFKLAADGLRDIMLVPVSIGAGIWGLIAGGDDPNQYFRRLQRFGRRTDLWINLFGQYRRGPTSDNLMKPLEASIYREFQQRRPERPASKPVSPPDEREPD